VTFNSNYFMPGVAGGDHALKFGGYWRDSNTTSLAHMGGFARVRFPSSIDNDFRWRRPGVRSICIATATLSTTC